MWDFAWFNIDSCAKSPSTPLLRYVPLAALPDSPKIARQPESGAAHLSFFGGPWKREACLQSIRQQLVAATGDANASARVVQQVPYT